MAKKKTVPIFAVEEIANTHFQNVASIDWNGCDIEVKHSIPIEDVVMFARMCEDVCFADDGEYMPEKLDFAKKYAILKLYTNIALPKDTSKVYSIVYDTDIVDAVTKYVSASQLMEIDYAIENRIKYKTSFGIDVIKRLADALTINTENMFGDVTKEDVTAAIKAMSGGLDEEKLVHYVAKEAEMKQDAE